MSGRRAGARGRLMGRLLDLYVATLGLAILWPFLALVAALIRLESPGSPVFTQTRVGRGGRPFTIFKFRTMCQAAPPPAHLDQIADFATFVFTPAGGDARRTRLGTVLRATSMDEALQLLNIVRGEMTLVGPRPEIPEVVAQYPPAYHERHAVAPGLTGLAQIKGRADLTYSETIAYDRAYVRNCTAALDLAILARTAAVVLRGAGAR